MDLITPVLLLANIYIQNYVNIQNHGTQRNEITILSIGPIKMQLHYIVL